MKSKTAKLTYLFFFLAQFTFAQKVVRGTVNDSNGPLPGASIIEQGTQTV